MKKLSYLMVSVLILALMAIGCGQDAPTASSDVQGVLQPNVREVETAVAAVGNPNHCCLPDFSIAFAPGHRADLNGDNLLCVKHTRFGGFLIDNNAPCAVPPSGR